jgi:cytochrome P450
MKFDYPSLKKSECPFPLYKQTRAECPVAKVDGHAAHFVSRHEDVLYVLQNPQLFSSVARTVGTQPREARTLKSGIEVRGMLESDPPSSSEHRRISTRRLNPKAFQDWAPRIRQHVDNLIDDFINDGKCEFISQFAFKLPAFVITDVLGLPPAFIEALQRWGQIETTAIVFFPEERKQKQFDVLEELKAFCRQQLIQRHENPTDDALGQLVRDHIERDGEFDLEYLVNQAGVLVSGGIITTGHHLGTTLLLLLQHPDQLAAVMNDYKLIPAALDECLRLQSPVQWVPRRVTKDTELRGQQLRAGSHVIVGLGSASRDEAKFDDAESFNIHRKGLSGHVAFGYGAHRCVGSPLARIEAQIALERMFDRLKNIRLSKDNDFRHIESPQMRGLNKLNIEFEVKS